MNGLLRTLIKPDWDDNPKRSKVIYAANLIEVGEFQFLQLAHKAWYKEELPDYKTNKIFEEYMFRNIIPIWVRYYADHIIKLDNANVLKIHDHKYHVYDNEFGSPISNERQRKRRGIGYTIIIAIVFISTHYMAATYVEEPAGFYPPYVEKKIVYPELYKNQVDTNYNKKK